MIHLHILLLVLAPVLLKYLVVIPHLVQPIQPIAELLPAAYDAMYPVNLVADLYRVVVRAQGFTRTSLMLVFSLGGWFCFFN